MAKKTAYFGIFTSLALGFGYLEALLPPLGVPGVKLGLSNAVTLISLYLFGPGFAVSVSLARILLSSALFSGFSGLMYSAAGGALSFAAMYAGEKTGLLGVTGVSILGGVFHNAGQIIVAAIIINNVKMFYYLPILLVSGAAAGAATGVASGYALRYLKFIGKKK